MVKTTKEIISDSLKKSKKLKEYYLKGKWCEIVGDSLVKRAKIEKLKDGVLVIKCDSSVVSNHIRLQSENIIEKINKILNDDYIKDIKIKN